MLVESANQFSLEELCRTRYSLNYFSKPLSSIRPSWKTLKECEYHILTKTSENCFYIVNFHFPCIFVNTFGLAVQSVFLKRIVPLQDACFLWQDFRITDEGSVPEMRMWSMLLIEYDLQWCNHLSRSLFVYFIYLVSVTLCLFHFLSAIRIIDGQEGATALATYWHVPWFWDLCSAHDR